jgi:acetyltransferase-like isoleucine patch superfamily enzyme
MSVFQIITNKLFYRHYISKKCKKVGQSFRLGYGSKIIMPSMFSFGDNFFSGPNCYMGTNKYTPINIANEVMFGPNVTIQGGNHDLNFIGYMQDNKRAEIKESQINIESGAWVGANSTIISGANIGEGSVIGAMSLVNKSIPPYTVSAGVPCKVKKGRFNKKADLEATLNKVNSNYTLQEIIEMHGRYGIIYS